MKILLTFALLFICVSLSSADIATILSRFAVGFVDKVFVYCDNGLDSGSFSIRVIGITESGSRTVVQTLDYPTDFTSESSLLVSADYDASSGIGTYVKLFFKFVGTPECRSGVSATKVNSNRAKALDLTAQLTGTDQYSVYVRDSYTNVEAGNTQRVTQHSSDSSVSTFSKNTKATNGAVKFKSTDSSRNKYLDVTVKMRPSYPLEGPNSSLSGLVTSCSPTSASNAFCDCTRLPVRYAPYLDTTNKDFVVTSPCAASGTYGDDIIDLSIGFNTMTLSNVVRAALGVLDAAYDDAPGFVFDAMEEDLLFLGNPGGSNDLDGISIASDVARQAFATYSGSSLADPDGEGLILMTATKGGTTAKRGLATSTAPILGIAPPSSAKRATKSYYCVGSCGEEGSKVIDYVATKGANLQLKFLWRCGATFHSGRDKFDGCELTADEEDFEMVRNQRSVAGAPPEIQFAQNSFAIGQRREQGSYMFLTFDVETRLRSLVETRAYSRRMEPDPVPEVTVVDDNSNKYTIDVRQFEESWISVTDAIALPASKFSTGFLTVTIEYAGYTSTCNLEHSSIGEDGTHAHFMMGAGTTSWAAQDIRGMNVDALPKTVNFC